MLNSRVSILFVLIAVLFSYPALAGERFVKDNTIVSDSLPRIKVRVSEEFKYAGRFDFKIRDVAAGERLVFINADKKKVKRMFIAQFEGFLPHIDDYFRYSFKNALVFGKFKFRQNPYAYSNSEARQANPKGEGVLTEDFLKTKGYLLEDELMMSRFITVAGADKKHELILFYLENVSSSGHSLSEFYKNNKSTPIWQKISAELKTRSLKSFEIK
ncbi:MAG: hypothetical protein HKN25_10310 [Pyrinomonadaceae bacterium]|nr:hypothetical protein [Pyrinomonadaceae bacterium]